MDDKYWAPEHVRGILRALGFVLPLEALEPYIRNRHERMRKTDKDIDGVGKIYDAHRRSIHPAMRMCREWGRCCRTTRRRWSATPGVHGLPRLLPG